jgi:hypothetical protein
MIEAAPSRIELGLSRGKTDFNFIIHGECAGKTLLVQEGSGLSFDELVMVLCQLYKRSHRSLDGRGEEASVFGVSVVSRQLR